MDYLKNMEHPLVSHQRQVHLDFHTSPHIHDVGCEFNAREFAQTFKKAHVNSATIFAKCHHGMSYYPTKVGTQHPALKGRDLLGDMIEALHKEDIRCPIYTTVAWEEDVASRFPQWRMMSKEGFFIQCGNADFNGKPHPGGWRFNNFLHPEYQDYIESHIRELFASYDVDGIFFDIVFFDQRACWSPESVKFRTKHHLLGTDRITQARFECEGQVAFAKRFTKLIRGLKKDATIFYNSTNPIYTDSNMGVRSRHDQQTHWELESLPSGFWGYFHFPRLARAMGDWGKPWLGMTGRFQRMWGDFGGIKPQAALEYECFRSQALGGANSIGDQLPPRGKPDAAAYDLIGAVYEQCEAAEPFYKNSKSLHQIAIVAPSGELVPDSVSDLSLEGAIQMCDEAHYSSVVVDDASHLDPYDLVILPDSVVMTDTLRKKLAAYLKKQGKVIFSHRSAFALEGSCELHDVNLKYEGEVEKFPTYWRTRSSFHPALSRSDRVFYQQGANVIVGKGTTILTDRVLPYFRRTDLTFSSHFQTPPEAKKDSFPAIVGGKNFVYFADPIFREYRQSGNIAARDAWKAAIQQLIGTAPFGHGLPSTVLSVPRKRGSSLILTLLHYIPTRKALDIDMIEEQSNFAGLTLNLPTKVESVKVFGTGKELSKNPEGSFNLPLSSGRLLLEIPGYFR